VGSKTLLQLNPAVLNWGSRLTQVVLYNGCKMVPVVVVVVAIGKLVDWSAANHMNINVRKTKEINFGSLQNFQRFHWSSVIKLW